MQPPINVVAHCRVVGTISPVPDSQIGFEVWLPASGWNGKFQGVGNGGLAGMIGTGPGSLANAVNRGYAVAGTDTGHIGGPTDGLWAIGEPEKVIDNAYRAIHETTIRGKAITQAFYGRAPSKSYFNGCSTGGRQALLEVQRYPDDYDGVIAGAPANFFTHLTASSVWIGHATLIEPGSYIPASKLPLIANAALAACDAIDGLTDGLIRDPRDCTFDPASLTCPGADASTCLTVAQVTALKKLYRGPRNPSTNERIFPGFEPGGELGPGGWATFITGPQPFAAVGYQIGVGATRGLLFENANYDPLTYNFASDQTFADTKLGPLYNAVDPDLSEFEARGGKIIMYDGWSDPVIAPRNTIQYWRSVVDEVGSRRETRTFLRLFMAPGMQHCSGGPGPFAFDAVGALERWVEQGVAPEQLVASHVNAEGIVDRTRPLCWFPRVAQYDGSGSIDDASNFTCVRKDGDPDED